MAGSPEANSALSQTPQENRDLGFDRRVLGSAWFEGQALGWIAGSAGIDFLEEGLEMRCWHVDSSLLYTLSNVLQYYTLMYYNIISYSIIYYNIL